MFAGHKLRMQNLILSLTIGAIAFAAPLASSHADAVTIAAVNPGWNVIPAPTDGPAFPAASVATPDGYRLYVWSREDERGRQVFAELHPPAGTGFSGEMPRWRIDDADMVDTDEVRRDGEEQDMLWGFTGDAVSIWMIWLGDAVVPADDPAHRWLSGETLEISIELADGSDRTIVFPLAGAGMAIEAAGEIRAE
jgi:hypothetical protein